MDTDIDALLRRSAITQLLRGWGLWRDTGDWARLRACYAPGARMRTTWFDGDAGDFVEASRRMAGAGGGSVQHFIGASVIESTDDRALAATRIQLLVRGQLAGTPVDVACYGRFHDRLVRHDGQWRIARREPVYDKDILRPVMPDARLEIDAEALARFPAHYRFTAYLQSLGGATITPDLPAPQSAQERQLQADDQSWLHPDSR